MSVTKKILVALCAVVVLAAVVTASVLGTVAYMVSASKVSNVFTVGNVMITLDESAVTPEGVPTGAGRTDKNSYHLMPGKSYTKDPAITVDPSTEACYLFLVTRNQITNIEVQGDHVNKPTMAQQMYNNGWAIYKDTTAGTRVWIYCGSKANITGTYGSGDYGFTPVAVCGTNRAETAVSGKILVASAMISIFQQFHVTTDPALTNNLAIYSGAEVTINAVGIQADSFGEIGNIPALDAAWAAVVNQFPYIQDNVSISN